MRGSLNAWFERGEEEVRRTEGVADRLMDAVGLLMYSLIIGAVNGVCLERRGER